MNAINELKEVLSAMDEQWSEVEQTAAVIVEALQAGKQLLSCGNGGSASDAMHVAEELIGRYRADREPLPAVCLNADVTAITCIANDFGYEQVFARQLEALGHAGDVFVAFSTSGNSPNVLAALPIAKAKGVTTILLTGKDGGKARGLCDYEIVVPSENTARIQEVHTLILHAWLEAVEAVYVK